MSSPQLPGSTSPTIRVAPYRKQRNPLCEDGQFSQSRPSGTHSSGSGDVRNNGASNVILSSSMRPLASEQSSAPIKPLYHRMTSSFVRT
ncbi:hypothetical protein PoB_001752100 [Plakobranchus ocellatus]|uniref:Uncharacterized protein n=1 Tax=Plakobranchus ocellatus TaxID=259542 RepID=A0AAV3Z8Q9_9GAST|nr:hypothetical protein PoB_001752100 [Plakobranchus ocellatus]